MDLHLIMKRKVLNQLQPQQKELPELLQLEKLMKWIFYLMAILQIKKLKLYWTQVQLLVL